jgi:hypothetical protein
MRRMTEKESGLPERQKGEDFPREAWYATEKRPDLQQRPGNEDFSEAWYAGLNSPLDSSSRALCTALMSHLGIGPRSRGVEYILNALEDEGDNHRKAMCLGEVMAHLANDPSDYYMRVMDRKTDFTTTHGFNHHVEDFYGALGIDQRGQLEVMKLVVEMSRGVLQTVFEGGRLDAKKIALVFEKVLDNNKRIDKKVIAAAIYNFFTAPLSKPE